MSDISADAPADQGIEPVADIAPEAAASEVESATVDTPEIVEDPAAPSTEVEQPSRLDVAEFGDRTVTVKVDGEELEVPLSEVLNGYQRQSDYTRKTQELAAERQQLTFARQLAAALEADPQNTLRILQERYAPEPDADDLDPVERQVRDLARWKEQQEIQAANQRLTSELDSLHDAYGEFDDNEVLQYLVERGHRSVTEAFKAWHYDQVYAQVKAERDAQRAADEAAREAAKRQAPPIEGGKTRSGAVPADVGEITSVADAWEAAKRQLAAR